MKNLQERLRQGCGDIVRDTHLMAEAADEIERLKAADQIIRDLMADNHWRHPRNDIYPRMIRYLKDRREPQDG